MCDCPFCTYAGAAELPLPVRVPIRPYGTLFAWGWLTRRDANGHVELCFLTGRNGTEYRCYRYAEDVMYELFVDGILPLFDRTDVTTDPENLSASLRGIQVKAGGAVMLPDDPRIPQGNVLPPMPTRTSLHCFAATPLEAEGAAPAKRRRALPAAPPAPPPPNSPVRVKDGEPYDVATIGGNRAEVRRVSGLIPDWDEDVVHHVLRYGARPPLANIVRVHDREFDGVHYQEVDCNFRAPKGNVIKNVRVAMCIVAALYKEEVAPYLK